MMRHTLKIIIGIFIIGIIAFLGYSIITNLNNKEKVADRIRTIPHFSFKTIEGEVFSQLEISKTKPKLFIYFNSSCDFCKAEAKQIQENSDQLDGVQLLFVSFEDKKEIKAFASEYGLLNQMNMIFLEDESMEFSEIFDVKSIPFMLLYSKENKLIKKFKGLTKIENVIMLL